MLYNNPERLGILACPGGNHFAQEIITHIRNTTRNKLQKRIKLLSQKYNLKEKEIINQINLHNDFTQPYFRANGSAEKIQIPDFRIPVSFTHFANGEFKTEILCSVRGMDIYIIQDVNNHYPLAFSNTKKKYVLSINDHIFCLFVAIDAVLQAGASRVTVVIPTYPYSRQHKKNKREGLTAARFGQMLENMGVSRIITLDIHSDEIENCFNRLRLEDLHASYQILKELATIIDLQSDDLVIVSPDTGAIGRNKFYAASLNRPLGMLYKERDYTKTAQSAIDHNITQIRLLGSIEQKTVFMADDMLGTGGTMLKALEYLNEIGVNKVICTVSLPLFSGSAIEHFEKAYRDGLFYRIIGTNAVYHDHHLYEHEWYMCANVSKLFAKSIYRLHQNRSLSALLDNRNIINNLLKKTSLQKSK